MITLLLPLGGLVGFIFGGLLCAAAGILLGVALGALGPLAILAGLIGLPLLLGPLAMGLAPITVVLLTLLAMFIVTAIAYALVSVALAPAITVATFSTAPTSLPTDPTELFVRGFIIGLGASVNFVLWTVVSGTALVGALFALVTMAATIPGVSALAGYQVVLGWTSWLLPMSHIFFVTPLGLLLFIVAAPFAIAASGLSAIQVDFSTGTIETTGGIVLSGPFAAFNLGNFTFLSGPVSPSSFTSPGIRAHETGHTLNVAAFGGAYHWVNAIDQNVPPSRGANAYGELAAESHLPRGGTLNLRVWS